MSSGMPAVYLGLLHYPVLDREGRIITTAVTNLDLHDLSRLARTYDLPAVYFVQPLPLQRRLIERLFEYWRSSGAGAYNPTRQEAFSRARLVESFVAAREEIRAETAGEVKVVGTTARAFVGAVDYAWLRQEMARGGTWWLCFGTGWGLAPDFLRKEMDYVLKPIRPQADYNHLSVRTAAAIILDRLLGERD